MQHNNPLISIIIPAFNASKYISQSVNCCLRQTYSNLEIIIVNDGSTDDTLEKLKKFESNDDRILIINKDNGGLVDARKSAIEIVKGEYVFFLDCDDIIENCAIEKLVNCSNIANVDIVIGNVHVVSSSNKTIEISQQKFSFGIDRNGIICSYLTKEIKPSLCFRLIRTSLLKKINTDSRFTIGEDFISNMLILEKSDVVVDLIDDVIYHYIQYSGSMVNRQSESVANARMIYIKWVSDYVNSLDVINDEEIKNCLAFFVLQEYYTFLRSGGDFFSETEVQNLVKNIYIKNGWALNKLTLWQKGMLLTYCNSPKIGSMFRDLLVVVRNNVRRIN